MKRGKKEILLGDCLELIKDIPSGSIDMVLCDLPYGTTACKWDTIIPLDKLWEQYERIIKPNGAIVLTAAQPFTSELIYSAKNLFKYEIIWEKEKPSNFAFAKYGIMKYHENILVFGEGRGTYNPQMTIGKPNHSVGGGKRKKYNESGANTARVTNKTDGLKHPKSVLKFNREPKPEHPTQKPVALFEYLIKTYTNEGDLVLDNAAGSGTTAIACLNTNRQFIVMEKERKYYDIINERVNDWYKRSIQGNLFNEDKIIKNKRHERLN